VPAPALAAGADWAAGPAGAGRCRVPRRWPTRVSGRTPQVRATVPRAG